MFFDLLAIRVIGEKVQDKSVRFDWRMTDEESSTKVTLSNGALSHRPGSHGEDADAVLQTTRAGLFKALQTDRINLTKPEVLFPWAAKQGLDQAKFESTYNSFGVATQLRKAVQLQDAYKVEGTPALGIAGRYYTDASLSNGFEPMIKLANQLIEQVRKGA